MSDRMIILTLSTIEATTLADLVSQFAELVDEATSPAADADPAVARLTPSAYPDDADADAEFRHATSRDSLSRRADDSRAILASLGLVIPTEEGSEKPAPDDVVDIPLDDERAWAWMRTLTAVRLVIASRLGIETEDDERAGRRADPEDPRFAVYDWLGYRLEGLVEHLSPDE